MCSTVPSSHEQPQELLERVEPRLSGAVVVGFVLLTSALTQLFSENVFITHSLAPDKFVSSSAG